MLLQAREKWLYGELEYSKFTCWLVGRESLRGLSIRLKDTQQFVQYYSDCEYSIGYSTVVGLETSIQDDAFQTIESY